MDNCNVSKSTSITQIVKPIDVGSIQMDNPAFNSANELAASADNGHTNESNSIDIIYLDDDDDDDIGMDSKTTDLIPIETVTTTTTTVKSEVFVYVGDEDGKEGKVEI